VWSTSKISPIELPLYPNGLHGRSLQKLNVRLAAIHLIDISSGWSGQ
jgi:hypothetical protein